MSRAKSTFGIQLSDKPDPIYVGSWKWSRDGRFANAAKIYDAARSHIVGLDSRRSELTARGKLTKAGIADELSKQAKDFYAKVQRWRGSTLIGHRRQAEAEIANLSSIQPRDPSDAAGQLLDMEMRRRFSEAPERERGKLLSAAISGNAPELAAALTRGPAWLSGVSEPVHEQLRQRAIPEENRAQVSELQEILEALDQTDRALNIATREIARMADEPPPYTVYDPPEPERSEDEGDEDQGDEGDDERKELSLAEGGTIHIEGLSKPQDTKAA